MTSSKPKVVYTYGVFDLFHNGHVELLKEAKSLGDKLIVGVFTDEVAASFKRKPIISEKDRLAVIKALSFVDQAILQTELSPENNLLKHKPSILAKGPGAGWEEGKEPPGQQIMNKMGGKVVQLSYHPGISTSDIINKIINGKI